MQGMSRRMRTLAAALLIAAGFAPLAHAEDEVDIATLTCNQMAAMKPEQIGLVLIWIEGYLGGRADDTVFSVARVQNNAAEVNRVCKESPARGVLDIIEKYEASLEEEAESDVQ